MVKIIGSAIVSQDGFIADKFGAMNQLFCCEDFQALQTRLDRSAPCICVVGRKTHERHENRNGRTRYVLSRGFNQALLGEHVTYFSDMTSLRNRIDESFNVTWHVLGGGEIYNIFGEQNLYTDFYLSINNNVSFGQGIFLSSDLVWPGADTLMGQWGLSFVDEKRLSNNVVERYYRLSPST